MRPAGAPVPADFDKEAQAFALATPFGINSTMRGRGGNFGVVTSFEFKLHPLGPEVLSGLIVHPLEKARELLTASPNRCPAIAHCTLARRNGVGTICQRK
jgi:hypothetical protein